MREIREILDSEERLKIFLSRKKKEVKVLIKAIFDLSKTIKKMKKQEKFLNELLDKKDIIIRNLKEVSKK